jgi:hypothetical protein
MIAEEGGLRIAVDGRNYAVFFALFCQTGYATPGDDPAVEAAHSYLQLYTRSAKGLGPVAKKSAPQFQFWPPWIDARPTQGLENLERRPISE